jgi:hypothetical protein
MFAGVTASVRALSSLQPPPGARLLAPVALALVRLRATAARTLLVALGIAAGAAVLAATLVGAKAVQDRAVQQALAALQPSDRSVQAVWSGVPGQSELPLAGLDRVARRALRAVSPQPPLRVLVFRQATWGGAFVNLGAVDGLSRWIALRSGRLPRPCRRDECELVQIGGRPVAPALRFLHVVGRAVLRPGAPFRSYFGATVGRRPPILLASGVRGLASTPLPAADTVARTYGWVVPLAARSVHEWQLAAIGDRLDAAQNRLEQASDIFSLSAPSGTFDSVRASTRVAGERLLVLGGDAAVLLLGFAVLASTRLRREQEAVRQRLTWLGATRAQIVLVAAVEVAGLTLAAGLLGWGAGAGAGALLARHLGSPGGLIVAHSLLTWRALAAAAALAALTAGVLLAALVAPPVSFGGLRVTVADVAALGALAAVLLALARGKADAASLAAGGGTGVLLLLLPALVLFVLAVAAARLLAPLLRALEWAGRRGPPSLRAALLSLARAPGQVVLSVSFFVVSVGVALFAVAYRATLVNGEAEQARYAVPAPYLLQEDLTKLVTVQQVGSFASLGRAEPVLREDGFVTGNGGRSFTLLALPPAALERIDGWRRDFSARSPAELARLLRPPLRPRLRGLQLPPSARRVTLPLRIAGDRLGVTLVVLDRRGDFSFLRFGELGPGTHAPSVGVPAPARGGRVVAVRLSFPLYAAFAANHRESGTSLSVNDSATGTIRLGRLRAGGRELPSFAGWQGHAGIRAAAAAGSYRYLLNRAADSILRPQEPLEGDPVPVVVTPAIGHVGQLVPLEVGDHVVPGEVVATTRYVPSVDGDAVVAELATWLEAANTAEPGSTTANEVWLDPRPGAAERLARPPFSALTATSQRAAAAALREDPLARGSVTLLLATALVALALAAVGVLLTVVGDLADESGVLLDLSALGMAPGGLRRHLLLRAGVLAAVGLGLGIAAGAIVCGLVVAVVTVTAGAADALPPLALVFDWPVVAAALGAALAAAALPSALAVRRLR